MKGKSKVFIWKPVSKFQLEENQEDELFYGGMGTLFINRKGNVMAVFYTVTEDLEHHRSDLTRLYYNIKYIPTALAEEVEYKGKVRIHVSRVYFTEEVGYDINGNQVDSRMRLIIE